MSRLVSDASSHTSSTAKIDVLVCTQSCWRCAWGHERHLGWVNDMGIFQADLEGQLQLMSKGVQGSQGAAGQQHTTHMHACQLAHAHSRREAPV